MNWNSKAKRVILAVHRIEDPYSSKSLYDYEVSLTLDDVLEIIRALAAQATKAEESRPISTFVASNLDQLLKLALCAAGVGPAAWISRKQNDNEKQVT